MCSVVFSVSRCIVRVMKDLEKEGTVEIWLEKAREDLKTAKTLLKSSRYTWCAFICQQAIEKCLKAGYVKKIRKIPPYTHKLEFLCQLLELSPPAEIIEIIIKIDKYYIATRYPSYKDSVNISSRAVASEMFRETERVFKWLLRELELKK